MAYSWRRCIGLLTLVAFLLGAMVPFFALYDGQIAQAGNDRLAELYGEEIFICTENGFQWVKLADLGGKEHAPKPDKHFECALCYVAAAGGKTSQLPPMVLALSRHSQQELQLHFAEPVILAAQWRGHRLAARAPPFIA